MGKGSQTAIRWYFPWDFPLNVYAVKWVCNQWAQGYLGWRQNAQQIARVNRQQQVLCLLLFCVVFCLILADVIALVYFHSQSSTTGDDDSFTSRIRKFVERLFNLEPNRSTTWDLQTIVFMVIPAFFNILLFFGLICVVICRERPSGPLIHIGDNNCCSFVVKCTVGAAVICSIIVVAIWYVYRTVPL